MALKRSERATMLEYAQFHRLIHPSYLDADGIEDHLSCCEPENCAKSTDDVHTHFHRVNAAVSSEKISINAEAGRFLASVFKADRHVPNDILDANHLPQAKRLKLEPPVLRTDHELDVCSVVSRGRAPEIVNLDDFKPVPLNDEVEQDLALPSRYSGQSGEIQKRCESERLEVGRESLAWLQSVLTDYRSRSRYGELDEQDDQRKHTPRFPQSLTPPLSPNLDLRSSEPFSSSSPLRNMPLLSEDSRMSQKGVTEFAENIFQQDALVPPNKSTDAEGREDEFVDLQEFLEIPTISQPPHIDDLESVLACKRPTVLKLDEPLLLPPSRHAPSSENQPSEDLLQLAGQITDPDLPETTESQDEFDAVFNEFINWEAAKVQAKLDNETLQEADATMRLAVPDLDFSLAAAPWIQTKSVEEERYEDQVMLSMIERLGLDHISVYEIEKQLDWVPFSMRVAKAVLDEEAPLDEEAIRDLIDLSTLPGETADLNTFLCLPKGLNPFRNSLDDQEIEPGEFDADVDLARLIRKRKAELDEVRNNTFSSQTLRQDEENPAFRRSPPSQIAHPAIEGEVQNVSYVSPPQSFFSTSDELHRFMCMQNGHVNEFRQSHHMRRHSRVPALLGGKCGVNIDPSSSSVVNAQSEESTFLSSSATGKEHGNEPMSLSTELLSPRSVIVSSDIMSGYRGALSHISRQYPSLDLISRDFSQADYGFQRNTDFSPVHLSPTIQKDPTDDQEADIITSPCTGIILTTLKKIKQKPLPGQKDLPAIRLRISRVCPRYENLIVIVNEDSLISQNRPGVSYPLRCKEVGVSISPQLEHYQLSQSDSEALESLQEFASKQTDLSTVTVIFGGSTNESLVKCLVSLMGTSSDNVKASSRSLLLFQDETTPELVLRKAGLNAFAAQAILMEMKAMPAASYSGDRGPSRTETTDIFHAPFNKPGVREDGISHTSLQVNEYLKNDAQTFLSMSPVDRKRRFAELVGGTRVLDRVEAYLERQTWEARSV